MPYLLVLPAGLAPWKVKIFDREQLEPPHVTVLNKTKRYRWDLRTRMFMDQVPPSSEVPDAVVAILQSSYAVLVVEWDARHPANPV